MTESLSHLPPGRRAAVDALVSERFSDPIWWISPAVIDQQDNDLNCGARRRALSEALAGIHDDEMEVA